MTTQRLKVCVEFSKHKEEDLELYGILQKYSNPGAYIKDVLRGVAEIPVEYRKKDNCNSM